MSHFFHIYLFWIPSVIAALAPLAVDDYAPFTDENWVICWYASYNDLNKLGVLIPLTLYWLFNVFLLFEFHFMGYSKLISSPEILERLGLHLITFASIFICTWLWVILSFIQDLLLNEDRILIIDDISFFFLRSSGFWNLLVWIRSPAISFHYQDGRANLEVTESLLFQKSALSRNQSYDDSDLDVLRFQQRRPSVSERSVESPHRMQINEPLSAFSRAIIIIEEGSTITRATKTLQSSHSGRNASVST